MASPFLEEGRELLHSHLPVRVGGQDIPDLVGQGFYVAAIDQANLDDSAVILLDPEAVAQLACWHSKDYVTVSSVGQLWVLTRQD